MATNALLLKSHAPTWRLLSALPSWLLWKPKADSIAAGYMEYVSEVFGPVLI